MKSKELNLNQFYQILKKYRKIIIRITLAITVFAIALSFIVPYKYTVQTVIMPPKSESSLGGLSSLLKDIPAAGATAAMGGLSKNTSNQVFIGILRSRTVTEYIIKKNNLYKNKYFKAKDMDELILAIQKAITIDNTKDGFIYLQFKWGTRYFPSKADKKYISTLNAKIANDAMKALDSIIRSQANNKARYSMEYISGEINKYNLKLDSIARKLEAYQKQNNLLEIDEQLKAVLQQAVASGEILGEAQFELMVAEKEFSAKSPQLQAIRSKYNAVVNQYKGIQSGGLLKGDKFSIPLNQLPEIARNYAILYRDREVIEQVILYLEMQRHQEAIQANRDVPMVEVLDIAKPPLRQTSPIKRVMALGGFFLGLLVSIIYIIYITMQKGKKELATVEE